jgi:toxin ParE1/3/4
MATYRLSAEAEADLDGIVEYTIETWSQAQSDRYLIQLRTRCQQLADTPQLDRTFDEVRPGLLRANQGSHMILYRRDFGAGIRVVRVLHQRMSLEEHLGDE